MKKFLMRKVPELNRVLRVRARPVIRFWEHLAYNHTLLDEIRHRPIREGNVRRAPATLPAVYT